VAGACRGEQLQLPCEPGTRFFDLYHGAELPSACEGGVAVLGFDVEPSGFGAVLARSVTGVMPLRRRARHCPACVGGVGPHGASLTATDSWRSGDGSAPPNAFLVQMAQLSATPLAEFSAVWAPLQQSFTETVRTPAQPLPEGMVDVPTVGGWLFESYCNNIEPTDDEDIPSAVGVQMPWEDT
jgi:iron(II)-dependent oxidoreductase